MSERAEHRPQAGAASAGSPHRLDLRGRRALVLGLGLSGFSSARWLAAHGARVAVADTRPSPPFETALAAEVPSATLAKGPFDDALFAGHDLVVISPGLPKERPEIAGALARGAELVGDVELFARALPQGPRVIGITGSNGKSTVTALTGALLEAGGVRAVVAGNIGTPVLDALGACENEGQWPDVFVVELSSYQLETTSSLALAAATVLNVTENHLDRYRGMDEYAAAKERIFARAAAQVLPRDDARCRAMRRPRLPGASFGAGEPGAAGEWGLSERDGETWLARWAAGACVPLIRSSALQLVGRHNALNALAALALAELAGCDPQSLLPALAAFRGLPHRMSPIGERHGVAFIDDSKATTVAAAIAALEGMGRPAVLIAGGDGKGQDFRPLAAPVDRHCRAVVLLGRDAPAIASALRECRTPVVRVASLEQAVETAARAARAGDAVLLSPACASLDMFRDFAHRGDAFAAACRALDGEAVGA